MSTKLVFGDTSDVEYNGRNHYVIHSLEAVSDTGSLLEEFNVYEYFEGYTQTHERHESGNYIVETDYKSSYFEHMLSKKDYKEFGFSDDQVETFILKNS